MEAEVEGDFGVVLSADIGTVKHTFTMPWKDSIHFNKDGGEGEYKKEKPARGGREHLLTLAFLKTQTVL